MHNCKPCEHKEVRYCPECGGVYCCECGEEWYAEQYPYYYPYQPREPSEIIYGIPYVTTSGGSWTDN